MKEEIFYMPHFKYNPHDFLYTFEDMIELFKKWDKENPDDQLPSEFKLVGDMLVEMDWDESQGEPFVYAQELPLGFSDPVGDA